MSRDVTCTWINGGEVMSSTDETNYLKMTQKEKEYELFNISMAHKEAQRKKHKGAKGWLSKIRRER
ncbi:MAG: hypothetical protein JXQ67_05175 [Campylobacterales bacterium]|nr:hypothetical protein [Campylobacterales bacterium]